MPSPHNILSILLLLSGWLVLSLARSRSDALRRNWLWVLVLLAPLALAAHTNFFRYERGLDVRDSWDFYHYYIGPKYFAELGHTGLYEAHTIADREDDPRAYNPRTFVRDLDDYSLTQKALISVKRDEIVGRFTPERWEEFKSDIAVFRPPDIFARRASRWAQDHGYNGSPLTTAINSLLAQQPFVSPERFIQIVSWFDLIGILLVCGLVGRWLGAQTGLLLLFFFGANPLNDYIMIGGSFLRYIHFAALALGIATLIRGRETASGIWFALATHLRLYPVLLPLALLASDLLRSGNRLERLYARRRFYLSYAVAGGLVVAATATIPAPGNENIWQAFYENSSTHREVLAINTVGLRYPFLYSDEGNLEAAQKSGYKINWTVAARDSLARNTSWFRLSSAVMVLLSIPILLRVRRPEEALFVGLAWVFTFSQLSNYDYMILSVVPLMFRNNPRLWQILVLAWITIGLHNFIPTSAIAVDWEYKQISLTVLFYLLITFAWIWRRPDVERSSERALTTD